MHDKFLVKHDIIESLQQSAIFVTRQFVLYRVISTNTIDISRKSREEATKKDSAPTCHQLINHPVIVCIHALQLIFKVIQKQYIIMLA